MGSYYGVGKRVEIETEWNLERLLKRLSERSIRRNRNRVEFRDRNFLHFLMCEDCRNRNRVEFRVNKSAFSYTFPIVEIETEWNLEVPPFITSFAFT